MCGKKLIETIWISSKYLLAFLIPFLLASCANTTVAGNEIKATDVPKQAAQPSKKVLKDGEVLIRHAGDEWSRQKIKRYLTENTLKLNTSPGTSTSVPDNLCKKVETDLEKLNFEFIKPDIITDDWQDPILEPYKAKYEYFKYGMGYEEKFGPQSANLPSWNINVYNINSDGLRVMVLYGERLLIGGREDSLGLTSLGSSYRLFENRSNEIRSATVLNADPSDPRLTSKDYLLSAIIKIDGIYGALAIYHWNVLYPEFSATFDVLDKYGKKRSYGQSTKNPSGQVVQATFSCRYLFNTPNVK